MKQSLILKSRIALLVVVASTFFASCIKDRAGQTDFSGLSPIVQIVEGGLYAPNFSAATLVFPGTDVSDTTYFRLNYAATNVAPNDIVVTLGYDAAALAAYNAANPSSQYEKMPDSTYSFTQTSVTIKAGQSYSDLVKFVVFPSKIDVSKSYMLPISITNASGTTISGNFATIYYHKIGNPLAGKYSWRYRRWQGADTNVAPLQDILSTVTLNPVSATQLFTRETYTETFVDASGGIILGFTNTAGVLSSFNLSLLPSTYAGITTGGFSLTGGPTFAQGGPMVVVGNAATSYIGTRFSTYIQYLNSTPANRSLINSFIKIP